MFFLKDNYSHPAFWEGVRASISVSPGLSAWGLMTGVAMVNAGMSSFDAVVMTLLVYAGSVQLAAIPLLAADAPMWVILATGTCVNLRFVVFSAHLRGYLMAWPRWQRLVAGYFTADLSYVQFVHRFPTPAEDANGQRTEQAYLAGHCGMIWITWVLTGFVGIALAQVIPLHWGLSFAGILALVGVTCSLANSRLRVVSAVVAGMAGVVAVALPLKLNIVVGIASAVALCMLLERPTRPTPDQADRP
jgi:predicted branched-subunit amino acid permease